MERSLVESNWIRRDGVTTHPVGRRRAVSNRPTKTNGCCAYSENIIAGTPGKKRHDPGEQIGSEGEPGVILEALLGGAGKADED
jgi:hypothetical protein